MPETNQNGSLIGYDPMDDEKCYSGLLEED